MQLFPGRTAYLLVLAVALVDAIWLLASPIALPSYQLFGPLTHCVLFATAALVIARMAASAGAVQVPLIRVGYFLQGLIFLQIAWIAMRVLNHLSMSIPLPYADDLLVRWDEAIGASWHAYFRFVQNHDTLRSLMDHTYTSLTLFSFVSFFILILQKDLRRARYFLETFLVTALVCTAIGMFFPAEAAVATYFDGMKALTNFPSLPGVYHLEHLERLRAGAEHALD
ncbi:MAG: phosphatase PAP2 family protein, partial [Parvibaculaceae bacterium]